MRKQAKSTIKANKKRIMTNKGQALDIGTTIERPSKLSDISAGQEEGGFTASKDLT